VEKRTASHTSSSANATELSFSLGGGTLESITYVRNHWSAR